jgi:hypothetical protein
MPQRAAMYLDAKPDGTLASYQSDRARRSGVLLPDRNDDWASRLKPQWV